MLNKVKLPPIIILGATLLILALLCFIFLVRLLGQIRIKRGWTKKHLITILGLGILGAIILFAFFLPFPPQTFFCQFCHVMRAEYRAWQRSSHQKIGCYSCHREPGISGYSIQKLKETKMLIGYLVGSYEKPVTSEVKSTTCLKCHQEIKDGVTIGKKIRVSHQEFWQEKTQCVDCHRAVVHKRAIKMQNLPAMERCTICHNNQIASLECKICHIEPVKKKLKPLGSWGISHRGDWPKIHGKGELGICLACHSKEYCQRCHIQTPHPDNWDFIHGKSAIKIGEACLDCHIIEAFCRDCHQIEMPHPENWLPLHSKETKEKGEKLCLACHVKEDCNFCHSKHIHPAVK